MQKTYLIASLGPLCPRTPLREHMIAPSNINLPHFLNISHARERANKQSEYMVISSLLDPKEHKTSPLEDDARVMATWFCGPESRHKVPRSSQRTMITA